MLPKNREETNKTPPLPQPKYTLTGVLLACALVVSIVYVCWHYYQVLDARLEHELSIPRRFGQVLVVPEGHYSIGLGEHHWQRIRITMPGLLLRLEKPSIRLNLLEELARELALVNVDSVDLRLDPQKLPHSDSPPASQWSHPDYWLPFRAAVGIGHLRVAVAKAGMWEADSLRLRNRSQKSLAFDLQDARGSFVKSPLDLRLRYHWGHRFSDASLLLKAQTGDSVGLIVNAPRAHLENISADWQLAVNDVPAWIPRPWPKQAPRPGPVQLQGDLQSNLRHRTLSYAAELSTSVGSWWQLPPMQVQLKASGNERLDVVADLRLHGKHGESVRLQGTLDRKLDASAQAQINGFHLTLGPQTLPVDATIHRFVKIGDSLHATVTTGTGSRVIGSLKGLRNPSISFSAQIAPSEPWAVQWTRGNVRLAPPTLIEGSFYGGVMQANVRSQVAYAYLMAAESFETDLSLSRRGIQFDNGIIRSRGHQHTFGGEVIWNDSIPHFRFSLEQDQDRFARVYGTLEADIDLSLAGIQLEDLPWADTTLLRGYGGSVTGVWHHSFSAREGDAQVSVSTHIKGIPLKLVGAVRQMQDSLFLDRLRLSQGNNQLDASAQGLLRSDSVPKEEPALRLLRAHLATRNFNLTEMASALRDSTLRSGSANGELFYDHLNGLGGGLVFSNLALRRVDSNQVAIPRLRLSTHQQQVQLSGRVKLGQGNWDGEAEITLDSAFRKGPHRLAGAFATDNGGVLWFDGFLDSLFKRWDGSLHLNGPWFLPTGTGEINETDFTAQLAVPFHNVLDSLRATFRTSQTRYSYGSWLDLPVSFGGKLKDGLLSIDSASVVNDSGEAVTARLRLDLRTQNLEELSFHTEHFTLPLQGMHEVTLGNASGYTRKTPSDLNIELDLPSISYRLKDKELGDGRARLNGHLLMRIPVKQAGTQANNSLSGNIHIEKAVYRKRLEIAPDPMHLDRTLASITRFLAGLRKEKPSSQDAQALTGRPTTLDIRISDTGRDSLMVISNLATFPMAVDLAITGTTRSPLISGDINAVGNGFIGFEGLATFELSSLRLYWQEVPWRRGQLEILSSHDFPFCAAEDKSEETCPISLNITGNLTSPQPQPEANCGIESSPALIYYSILLGCVSQEAQNEGLDKNKFTGRLLGNLLASTANKGLGGEYIGDIDLKMRIFENTTVSEKDSSYLRIPVSLDRWVRNLKAVFGYTQDQSVNPRYDQSIEGGLQYTLPIFDSTETSQNLIDPRLDASANLVARRYPATMETSSEESRVEKNIGLVYNYKFWDPCILGLGLCAPRVLPDPSKEKQP